MNMKTCEMIRRSEELRPIQDMVQNDPVIQRVAEQYIHGRICTLTECLFQMVRASSAQSQEAMAREIDMITRSGFFNIIPK